jgi:N-dimethylarginine dimethylaminohydrolase
MLCVQALDQEPPKPIKNWKIIEVTVEESHRMGTNTLCIEPGVVLIGSEHKRLIAEIEKNNAKAIPIPFEYPSQWGGGIRCSVHPVSRKLI